MVHLVSDCTHLTRCPKLLVRINDLAKVTFEHANTNKLVVDQLANLTVSMQEIVGKFKL